MNQQLTTRKMRFVHQPHTYKSFLEILHTFHREQHTIKDVYDQVATLFHDHPDLLEEFSQFLPDPQANQNLQPSLARKAARVGKSGKLEQVTATEINAKLTISTLEKRKTQEERHTQGC